MSIIIGPVLSFRGCGDGVWRVSVLAVIKQTVNQAANVPAQMSWRIGGQAMSGASPEPLLWRGTNRGIFCFLLDVSLTDERRSVTYRLGDREASFEAPARGESPQIAYASCNGFSSSRS